MTTKCNTVLVLCILVTGTLAQFNPTLVVDSCTQSTLQITINDAADGGIVYIQGQDAACRQTTVAVSSVHTINFGSCNIQWEESFKIVIQKKALYQTGDDKQIPVMCIADLGDLTVTNNLNAADKDDDAGQNKTVKPTATMALYRGAEDIGGGTVKLTDTITMVMQLDAEFLLDFDLKAKSCMADNIDIILDACAVDIELFPHMTRTSQGILTANFGAFRTTSLTGGSVAMPFSCTLQVCLGACNPTTCLDGSQSYGRKKRGIEKRQADDNVVEDIAVGSTISIATEEVVIEAPEDNGDLCMNQGLFVAIIIIMVGGLAASSAAAVFMFRKMQEKASILSKLNGGQFSMPVA